MFRHTRNIARNMIKKDKLPYNRKMFSRKNRTAMWGAAQQFAGKVARGPPTQLAHDGTITSSPKLMFTVMNMFFTDKVKNIHLNSEHSTNRNRSIIKLQSISWW